MDFEYDPETKRQSCQWKSPTSPRPKKARQSKSKVKVVLITFFDTLRVLATGPDDQSASLQWILRLLLRSVREKRRQLWQDKSWLLHHDNAPAHNTLSIRQFLAEKNIAVGWNNLHIHMILLRVTFFFSPSSRGSSTGPVLKAWRPSRGL